MTRRTTNISGEIKNMESTEKFISDRLEETFQWYQQADMKAQIFLGFIGVFISVIIASLLSSGDASNFFRLKIINLRNKILVMIVLLSYFATVATCVIALWSRSIFFNKKKGVVFFGHIANYPHPRALMQDIEMKMNRNRSLNLLNRDLYYLAKLTRTKHFFVNLAAIFSGIALTSTVLLAYAIFSM